jgi:xylose isomerase
MDVMAKSLERAAAMIENDVLSKNIADRYAGWNGDMGKGILSGATSLEELAKQAVAKDLKPVPASGKQEYLENVVNDFIFK